MSWSPPPTWPAPPYGWQLWVAAGPPAGLTGNRPTNAYIGVVVGAGIFAVSPFLPWVNVVLFGSADLFDLFRLGNEPASIPWIAVFTGVIVCAAALAFSRSEVMYAVVAVVGILIGVVDTLFVIRLLHAVSQADGLASVGVGPFAAIGGLLTAVIAAFIGIFRS